MALVFSPWAQRLIVGTVVVCYCLLLFAVVVDIVVVVVVVVIVVLLQLHSRLQHSYAMCQLLAVSACWYTRDRNGTSCTHSNASPETLVVGYHVGAFTFRSTIPASSLDFITLDKYLVVISSSSQSNVIAYATTLVTV
ncbi:hypothetical protein Tco_0679817 [Tanacetum coccineum]|uniref:Uncharacterized protein n=1 Tax=Tanacetum coccineum TaxID=301880 RepID=A0ABQ4XJX7_9ASTR